MGLFNNEREIVNGYKDKFRSNPSESLAQKLESLGMNLDYSNKDAGEEPKYSHTFDVRKLEVKYDEKSDRELAVFLNKHY